MQIKAQWIGWAKTVNAAVALKAVENMTLEAGVYIPTASAERADGKLGHKTKIGAFWGMPVGPVALKVNAEVALAANDTETTESLKKLKDFGTFISSVDFESPPTTLPITAAKA